MRARPVQTYATRQNNRVALLALPRKTSLWAGSSVGERCVRIAEVGGSNPPRSTKLDGRQNHLRDIAESDRLTVIRRPGDYGSQQWPALPSMMVSLPASLCPTKIGQHLLPAH